MSVLLFILLFVVGIGVFFKVSGFVIGLLWQGISLLINSISSVIIIAIAVTLLCVVFGILGTFI
nr:MAG TPA: hypothetical protein [Caudoviricetes sp.]